MNAAYVAIFEMEGNEFFFMLSELVGETKEEVVEATASQTALLTLGGLGTPVRYEEIDLENTLHAEASLELTFMDEKHELPIAITSGPLLDKAMEDSNDAH